MSPDSRPIALRVPVLLFFTCFAAYALIVQGANSNSVSRIAVTLSLLRSGTVAIDDYAGLTEDKASSGSHFYSDKAPGMSLLALPALAVADLVARTNGQAARLTAPDASGALAPTRLFGVFVWIATIATSGLISAMAVAAFCDVLAMLGLGSGPSLGFATVLGLGTPVWGWSTTFFSHAVAGAFLILALWAILRATRSEGERHSGLWHATLGGFLLGFAVVTEFTVIPAVGCLCVFALSRLFGRSGVTRPVATIVAAAASAAIPLAALAFYNEAAFGSPFAVGYASVVGFEGMKTGIFGIAWPRLDVLSEIVVGGRRGILWLCPVLIFLPWAAVVAPREQRGIVVLSLAIVATFLLINASYAYWDGGRSTGPRHIVPALGFALLPIALAYPRFPKVARLAVVALSVAGVIANLVAATTDMYMPTRFTGITLFTYLVPEFWRGTHSKLAVSGLISPPMLSVAVYIAIVGFLGGLTVIASRTAARQR